MEWKISSLQLLAMRDRNGERVKSFTVLNWVITVDRCLACHWQWVSCNCPATKLGCLVIKYDFLPTVLLQNVTVLLFLHSVGVDGLPLQTVMNPLLHWHWKHQGNNCSCSVPFMLQSCYAMHLYAFPHAVFCSLWIIARAEIVWACLCCKLKNKFWLCIYSKVIALHAVWESRAALGCHHTYSLLSLVQTTVENFLVTFL